MYLHIKPSSEMLSWPIRLAIQWNLPIKKNFYSSSPKYTTFFDNESLVDPQFTGSILRWTILPNFVGSGALDKFEGTTNNNNSWNINFNVTKSPQSNSSFNQIIFGIGDIS